MAGRKSTAKSNVVRFPTHRIVRDHFVLCDGISEMQAIDHELRSVEHAIAALKRRHRGLIIHYRDAYQRYDAERAGGDAA